MFKAYNDTTCIILLLIISTSIPFANSMLRSQKPICSLTIECPNKSQVCIRSECVHLAATSNDVWIFAYGAIATFLLVKVIITSDVISRFQNIFFWQISWLIGCYYLCWWCPGSRRFAHPATIKVTDGSRAACKGARKWLISWRLPKAECLKITQKVSTFFLQYLRFVKIVVFKFSRLFFLFWVSKVRQVNSWDLPKLAPFCKQNTDDVLKWVQCDFWEIFKHSANQR